MKKIFYLLLLLSFGCQAQFFGSPQFQALFPTDSRPEINIGKIDANDTIIKYQFMIVCYDKTQKESHWSSYFLCKNRLGGKLPRKSTFIPDPTMKDVSAKLCSFKVHNYDIGHLTNANDMNFNQTAEDQCFYFQNVCPQWYQMNRGVFKQAENYVRKMAPTADSIFIVSGVIFGNIKTQTCLPIPIPSYFWKIIRYNKVSYYYLFPNTVCNNNFEKYQVTEQTLFNAIKH
jgi:endonuclease G